MIPRPPLCSKCGKTTKLILTIARLGEKPGTKVFQCSVCKYLTWTETLEKADPIDVGHRAVTICNLYA
jgi:transcription elongation factor Elf1